MPIKPSRQEKQLASNRFPTAPDTQRGSGGGSQANNQSIWLDICRGRYDRKNDLTALSFEAADCLVGWKEPDLFLNGIKELSPEGCAPSIREPIEVSHETIRHVIAYRDDGVSSEPAALGRAEGV